jgi:hypothetical protein
MPESPAGLHSDTPGGGFLTFARPASMRSGIIEGALEVRGLCLPHPACSVLRCREQERPCVPLNEKHKTCLDADA